MKPLGTFDYEVDLYVVPAGERRDDDEPLLTGTLQVPLELISDHVAFARDALKGEIQRWLADAASALGEAFDE